MTRFPVVFMAALALSISTPLLAQMATKAGKAPKQVVAAASVSTEIINLNTATAAQIALLPGIGPKTADLIVQYRQKNNGFKKVEEIL
jgi:competence protein ComEA